MAIRKFGTGDGRVTGVDEQDPQGISREAATQQQVEWTRQDEDELRAENES